MRFTRVIGCMGVVVLQACSASPVEPLESGSSSQGVGAQGSEGAESGARPFDRYVGKYASYTRTVTNSPSALGNLRAVGTAYSIAEIRKKGDGYEMEERSCRVETQGSGPALTIPDAYPRSLPLLRADVEFRTLDDGRVHLTRRQSVSVAGARLERPEVDPLPTRSDDPRVFDQDGDGKPGVTANVSVRVLFEIKGDLYLVQRIRLATESDSDGQGGFRGKQVSIVGEQVVLDASPSIFKINVESVAEPTAPETEVRYVPVSGEMGCDDMLAQRDRLFRP